MSPKRGDRAAPPPIGDEFDLRFANTEAANGWDHLSRHAAGNLRRAFDKIRSAPRAADDPERHHRLKGKLGATVWKGQTLERWQYEDRRRPHLVPGRRRRPHRLDHLRRHRTPQSHRLIATSRPHQALDMQSPGERFTPVTEQERDVLGLGVPGVLALVPQQRTAPAEPVPAGESVVPDGPPEVVPAVVPTEPGGPVEFERVVPLRYAIRCTADGRAWTPPWSVTRTARSWQPRVRCRAVRNRRGLQSRRQPEVCAYTRELTPQGCGRDAAVPAL